MQGKWLYYDIAVVQFCACMQHQLLCGMQGKWLYLEPIFSSEEIMKQIPKEGSAFRQMDATWRNIMNAVKQKPLIVDVCLICPRACADHAQDKTCVL